MRASTERRAGSLRAKSSIYEFPLMTPTAVYQGQRGASDQKRVFILSRSGYAGLQRNSAAVWSGDVNPNWETFRRQIPAGLNLALSGIPYWTTDIGGFVDANPDDPAYRELYVRWFEFGAFCPIFQLVPDRFQQLSVITAGKIGAPDRACEQHVADDRQTLRRIEKDDAARRVTRAMQDVECQLPDLDLIAIFQPAVRCHVHGVPHAKGSAAFGGVLQQKQVIPMRPLDRYFAARLQGCGTAHMIDVAVGQPDFVDRDAGLSDGTLDVRQVAARIDDHGTLCGLAPQ